MMRGRLTWTGAAMSERRPPDAKMLGEVREMLEERQRIRLWVWRFRHPLVLLVAAPLCIALSVAGAALGAVGGTLDAVNYCRNAWKKRRPQPPSDQEVRFVARMKGGPDA